MTSLGIGEETLDVIWQVDDEEFSGTFEQNKTYTATIKLQADEYYSFADEVTRDLRRGTPTTAFTGGTPTRSG